MAQRTSPTISLTLKKKNFNVFIWWKGVAGILFTYAQYKNILFNRYRDILYKCTTGSRLELYLKNKLEKEFTLQTLVKHFLCEITKEQLYDARNTEIIVFSEELESVLGVKAIKQKDLAHVIFKQVEFTNKTSEPGFPDLDKAPKVEEETCTIRENFIMNHIIRFKPERQLACCLMVQMSDNFTLSELKTLVFEYINKNGDRLCDPRNQNMICVKHDALGVAFEVDYFDLTQLKDMILKRTILLHPKIYPELYKEE